MTYLPSIGLTAVLLLGFQLASYGISLWILKHSTSALWDLWWLAVVFAVPLGALEFVWVQAWRMGLRAELSLWSMLVLVLACQVAGSAASVAVYSRQMPSWGNLAGLFFAVAGAAITIVSKR